LNIAPGVQRGFISEDWNIFEEKEWDKYRNEAKLAADYSKELDILGTDIDGRMIEIAKRNAEKAGVEDFITFKQMQLSDFHTDKEYGVIVSNPPYGERMDDQDYVENLYKQMGEVFRPMETWSKYVITSDLLFEEFYGQRATKKRKLYNGRL